jgi:hypothetical protein
MRPTPIAVVLAGTAALSVAPTGTAAAASAPDPEPSPATQGRHCLAEAVTIDEMRRGVPSAIDCYDTYAEALEAAGIAGVPSDISPATAGSVLEAQSTGAQGTDASGIQAQSFVLGTHYDGYDGSGVSITAVGPDCRDRVVNLVGDFAHMNNRISSTRHGACPRIKHFTDFEMQGTPELSSGGPGTLYNLGGLNNQTSSLRFLEAANP